MCSSQNPPCLILGCQRPLETLLMMLSNSISSASLAWMSAASPFNERLMASLEVEYIMRGYSLSEYLPGYQVWLGRRLAHILRGVIGAPRNECDLAPVRKVSGMSGREPSNTATNLFPSPLSRSYSTSKTAYLPPIPSTPFRSFDFALRSFSLNTGKSASLEVSSTTISFQSSEIL